MVLLGDEAHLEARFGPFGDSANLDAKSVHSLRRMYHRLRSRFRTHPMVLLGDEAQLEACFGPFGDSAILDARSAHCLRRTNHRLRNCFGRTR